MKELPKNFAIFSTGESSHLAIQQELLKHDIDFLGGDGKPKSLPYEELTFIVSEFTGAASHCLFYGPPRRDLDLPYLTLEDIKNCST